MPIYPYSFQLPPLNVQDIPNDGAVGEFLGISAGGVLDWLPVAGGGGGGDLLAANNLSELTPTAGTARTNLGLGTGDSPTFKNLVISTGSIATSAPVTISQTWDGTGSTVFKALVVNATTPGTTSSSGSSLLDLQVGGVSKFSVRKDGAILGNNTNTIFGGGIGNFFNGRIHVGDYNFSVGSNTLVQIAIEVDGSDSANAVILNKDAGIYWSSLASAGTIGTLRTSSDLTLRRDSANTLALRNSTAAQTFNVYGTFTTAITNFERLAIKYNATDVAYQIAAEKGSDNGDYRPLDFVTGGSRRMTIGTTGNVGIGTTTPTSNLTVAGTFNFGSANGALPASTNYGGHLGGTQYFGLRSTSAVSTTLYLVNESSGNKNAMVRLLGSGAGADHGGLDINTIESSPIIFTTGASSERMRITAAGNVGIGTTAPSRLLTVVGNALFGTSLEVLTSTPLNVSFGGTYGNNTPGLKANLKWDLYNDGTTRYGIGMSAGLMEFQAGTTGGFGFYPNNSTTSALHIISSGNVGIGTTAPSSKLHVAGELGTNLTTFDSGAAVKITNTTGTPRSWLLTSGIVNVHNEFFCIRQESVSQPALIIAPTTNNIGVGINSPPSKLTVANGDIEVSTIASGLILKSPDGTRYRITVPNGGTVLTITAV